jgi:hypothetical protein
MVLSPTFGYEGGAILGKNFLALFKQVGFADAGIVTEAGFESSPITEGMLFRTTKPMVGNIGKGDKPLDDLLTK